MHSVTETLYKVGMNVL